MGTLELDYGGRVLDTYLKMTNQKKTKTCLLICLVFQFAALSHSQESLILSNSIDALLAKSSSPSAIAAEIVSLSVADPAVAPALTLLTLDRFKRYMTDAEFVAAAQLIIQALASSTPSTLPLVLEKVLGKYPDLALPLAAAAVAANPALVEAVAEAVTKACPELDTRSLSKVLASSTGSEMGAYDYLFSGFEQSGTIIPRTTGGGSPIYRE